MSTTQPPPSLEERVTDIERRLGKGSERMSNLEGKLTEVATELRLNTDVTMEVRELLAAFKGGFKVLGWFGVGAKWVGILATAGVAVYTLLYSMTHGGQLPK